MDTAAQLINAAIAPATKSVYGNALRALNLFLQTFYPGNCVETCSLEMLLLFISFLYKKGRSANTISTYIAALSYIFKMKGVTDLSSHFLVQKMLRGAKRLSASPDMRRPITLSVLSDLLDSLSHVCNSFYQQKLFTAMFLLAFHAFLRIGEITVRGKENPNLLQLENISVQSSQTKSPTIVVMMSNFKHNASKQTVALHIQSQRHNKFCPVTHFNNFLHLRGGKSGPLFCYRDLSPITRTEFCSVLNASLLFANYDTKTYKSHSFRIGAATTAHMLGLSDSKIRAMGRWHSDSYLRYIRIPMLPGLSI